jgi:hypothetical protein
MSNNSNGLSGPNGSHGWWKTWRNRHSQREVDLSSYRRLAVQLHHSLPRETNASRSVLLVTPNESRYWANGCVSLASCLAEELRRPVLLAEFCNSEICPTLESFGDIGLSDVLNDPQQPLSGLAMQTSQENLWFLSTRGTNGRPFALSTEDAQQLLVRAAEQWDFVILGGGPLLTNSAALAMAPYVGRVLLLVTENRTHLEDIDIAKEALQHCGAVNVSLVLTEPDRVFR